jgi:Mannosyl-glycoprotein endo-beta-N-acetylglucosaminidase
MVQALRVVGVVLALLMSMKAGAAATLPEIRVSARNAVPACITPERLMDFVGGRNDDLPKRFQRIAHDYARHGAALGLRWDMAFFQMLIETNWLRFHRANGRPGLVTPDQNNFAGLGATGRGQEGSWFPDVSTGVLAHLQHVKLYSGAVVEKPVARRTALVQEWGEIPAWARGLGRPVRFSDLTRQWSPHDRGYASDIAKMAEKFADVHCAPSDAAN